MPQNNVQSQQAADSVEGQNADALCRFCRWLHGGGCGGERRRKPQTFLLRGQRVIKNDRLECSILIAASDHSFAIFTCVVDSVGKTVAIELLRKPSFQNGNCGLRPIENYLYRCRTRFFHFMGGRTYVQYLSYFRSLQLRVRVA